MSLFFAAELRRELSFRNREYACRHSLGCRESYGDPPVVCYIPSEDGLGHGNFLPTTYRAILKNDNWRRRLSKAHSHGGRAIPREERRWNELDSCNSSDALLMNIFCFPGTLKQRRVLDLLGTESGHVPEFGYRPRIPLLNGHVERTEVDMRLGDLLVEAKLTESDFQSTEPTLVENYRDLEEVFDRRSLPREGKRYLSYQLIRNVLAAHASDRAFCVVADARRPDLREAWYAVLRCVRSATLRTRCQMLTWQELSAVLPRKLRDFLEEKYGITSDEPQSSINDVIERAAS